MLRLFTLSATGAIALSACTTAEIASRNPYATLASVGSERLYGDDIRSRQFPQVQSSANGTPLAFASFAGIEGARRAHQIYTRAEAEALDGRCERYIEPAATETLIDIANLCDVPFETLVAYNPDVKNVNYAERVVTVEIPGGKLNPSGTFAASNALAGLYAVQSGDTLSTIAYRLNVSADALANLNPDVTWTTLTPGQLLQRPVTASPAAVASVFAPAAKWEGYAGNRGGSGAARPGAGVRHAPYALAPTRPFAGRDPGMPPEGSSLVVDKPAVLAGENVRATAKRLAPGEEVTFFVGDDLDRETDAPKERMKEVARVRADANGEATASIRIKRKSDMGGVIIKASPEGSREALYSDRIGVVQLEAADDDEEENDEAEE